MNELRGQHLERSIRTFSSAEQLNFSTNDYLDLSKHAEVVAAAGSALREYGTGARASRLVAGSLPIHDEMEQRLAEHKGYPAALLFGSGYLANVGIVPALVGRDDHLFVDRLAHASILDASVLSRAHLHRFQHNDVTHLEELLQKQTGGGRRLIVTESVFSMDGDLAPLKDIAQLATQYEAMLLVDEAHATGVFGPGGQGLVAQHNIQSSVDLSMCTLSKALGSYGGAVACSPTMRDWLVNKSRALIYTTAPPPAAIGAALGALAVIERQPDLGQKLLRRSEHFRKRLAQAGLDMLQSQSQIIPVLVGGNEKALALSERLRAAGMLAIAIRPPTVPKGEARLRLSITLAHSEAHLEKAADILIDAAKAERLL